jgi:tetratricopeptide (TPR) repeat protein
VELLAFSYLSLFAAALYYIWRKKENNLSLADKSLLTGLLAGYMFNNMFIFDNLMSYILFFSVLSCIHSLNSKEIFLHKIEISKNIAMSVGTIVAVLAILSVYYFNVKPIMANQDLLSAIRPQKNISQNVDYFKKVFALNTFGNSEAREQLLSMAQSILGSKDASPQLKSNYFNLINDQYKKQLAQTPNDVRYLLFYGNFLNQVGDYDSALTYLQKAKQQSPKRQVVYQQIGVSYLGKKDYQNAISAFKTAYELEPKNISMADGLIEVYAQTKNYSEIVPLLEKKLENNPKDIQNWVSLAAGYYQNGEIQKAIEEIQKAIENFPQFKTQGEDFIRQMKSGIIKIQ